MSSLLIRGILAVVVILALCGACAHLPQYAMPGGPSPTPAGSSSPSPAPSPSPAACTQPAANTTAFIVISVTILPVTAPTYGPINGYVEANSDGTFGLTAQAVNLHTSDIVQFVNVDDYEQTTTIYHSAVSFPAATAFPAVPYSFPAATQQPVGTSISSTQWSTGRFGTPSAVCYSQTFSLSAGTYYFGDYDFYNSLNSLRDVLVVQSSGSSLRRRRAVPIILSH